MSKEAKKILIVEDEISMLEALSKKFLKEGFEVIQARDGKEGLLKAIKEHPDLILLDIILPKMDGISMMAKLRANGWGKKVKIIILTNLNIDDGRIRDVTKYKPAFYLTKADWKLKDVIKKAEEVVG